jgi:hypothetical protein
MLARNLHIYKDMELKIINFDYKVNSPQRESDPDPNDDLTPWALLTQEIWRTSSTFQIKGPQKFSRLQVHAYH